MSNPHHQHPAVLYKTEGRPAVGEPFDPVYFLREDRPYARFFDTLAGRHMAVHMGPGVQLPKLTEGYRAAPREAHRMGRKLGRILTMRWDYWSPDPSVLSDPPPALRCIARVPERELLGELHEWGKLGYAIKLDSHMDPDLHADLWDLEGHTAPRVYGKVDGTTLLITGYLLDLSHEPCFEWIVNDTIRQVDYWQPDAMRWPLKTGWNVHGSPLLPKPGEIQSPAPLTTSHYGPGQYEALVSAMIERLSKHSIYGYLNEQPELPGPTYASVWLSAWARAAILGWMT